MRRMTAVVGALTVSVVLGASSHAARDLVPAQYKNCTVVNKRYPHGIGKIGLRITPLGLRSQPLTE